ncbi:MAG: oligosaccharide flippase family protein [Proteobacteria bacterium]|nr:oligosaccharide flippase family protein [Pseudomonadota bacterium]
MSQDQQHEIQAVPESNAEQMSQLAPNDGQSPSGENSAGAPKDQAYDTQLHENPKKSIRKGFVWIGFASIVSQILDAAAMVVAMIFLTTQEMGMMTLALSFSVIFEAFNSLGTNQALLQDNKLTPQETHSVFWFASGFGIVLYLIGLPIVWPMAAFYESAALIPLFLVALIKVPLVSFAAIPLQLINRRFEYKKISAITTLTTLTCNILKIVLAVLGFGAWSFVIPSVCYGGGTLLGAFLLAHYRPQIHFKWFECKRFIQYGVKTCMGNAFDQLVKNLHFFIVGKFLGEGALGVYKIAYELAMTPALALYNVVGKSSFPIFSRLQDKRAELSDLFKWNQRNLSIFAAIPCVFLLFCAVDIFNFLPNKDWNGAAPIIPFALALAYIRSIAQTYPDLYRACGHPEYPIGVSGAECALVLVFCSGILFFFPQTGIPGMLSVWTCILLGMFMIHRILRRKFVDVTVLGMLRQISHGLLIMIMVGLISFVPYHFLHRFEADNPSYFIQLFSWNIDLVQYMSYIRIGVETLIILACILLYRRLSKRQRPASGKS